MAVKPLHSERPPEDDAALALYNLEWMIVGLQLRENCAAAAQAEWSDAINFHPTLKRIQEEIFTVHRDGHRPSPQIIAARLVAEELPGISDVGETLRMWSLAAPAVLSDEGAIQWIRGAFQSWRVSSGNIHRANRRRQADELLKARGVEAFEDVAALLSECGGPAPQIHATPFCWAVPEEIPARKFLFASRHAVAGHASATGAFGGTGKSTLAVAECLAHCTGRNLLNDAPLFRGRAWLLGLEDPIEEHQRRVAAAALLHKINPHDFEGRFFLDDAGQNFVIARQGRDGLTIAEPLVKGIINQIDKHKISLLCVDPFVASHGVPENDNGAIDTVSRIWVRIARETGCSVELYHHLRKSSGAEPTVDDFRGAGALIPAVRSARLLATMTQEEAERTGEVERYRFFRVIDCKKNMAARSSDAPWRQIVAIDLRNGKDGEPSDHVATLAPWRPAKGSYTAAADEIEEIKAKIRAARWRENEQASDWVGNAVADVLGLDLRDQAARRQVKASIREWIDQGVLCRVEGKDSKSRPRQFIEVAG